MEGNDIDRENKAIAEGKVEGLKETQVDVASSAEGEKCSTLPTQGEDMVADATSEENDSSVKHVFKILGRNRAILFSLSVVAALVVVFFIGTAVGYQKEIDVKILAGAESMDRQYTTVSDKLNAIRNEYDNEKTTFDAFSNYKSNASKLESDLSSAQGKLSDLQGQVTAKQAELDQLTGAVLKAAGQPVSLPSGDYRVGTDLKQGRYTVSGSSNFQVYSSSGEVYINTILGNGMVGRGDYTAALTDGMIMHCAAKTTFTPVS